nr:RNA polymerase I-specific transcription initiation factor RRN3 isoform X2 [Parasteatoda tepidariorum]XP_042897294.1 RNA polymerase I-specific transcription initiation factor RRN3 isoform X3 [Parasteatoda tepidariorum]
MAMVLQPILKTNSAKGDTLNSPRVTFNLPNDQGMIQYLKAEDNLSHSSKLHSIIKLISSPETDDQLIIQWLNELKDNIRFLDNENKRITYALLAIPWYTKDAQFIAAYKEFILNLIIADMSYLNVILTMFIKAFISGSSMDNVKQDLKRSQCIHLVLKSILELVPISQNIFCTMMSERFPYIKSPPSVFLSYVQNMLTVSSYLQSKRPFILQCIIEKLIYVDVHCSRETIAYYEQVAEDNNELMESMDTEAPANAKTEEMAYLLARTLDILMDCLFKYIKRTCFLEGKDELDWKATKKLYKELLTIFDKVILPTQECCHVQYLMFYICSLKQDLCDGFLDYLWKKVQDLKVGFIYRQIAAFYIGSVLSRAKYVSINTVTACFDLMSSWIHRYINAHTSQDVGVHGTFHSVCQAMFYVFSFRIKELLNMPDGYRHLQSLNFDRIVTCRLNPLKYCDKTIVQNFASTARNHQIAYVYPVIEKNNRNLLYSAFESKEESNSTGSMIRTFFPFDPYLLKKSKQWIEPHFRIYNHSHKEEDLEDHTDDEMDVNDELFSYSCSPGFTRVRSVLKDANG